jgi:hypothetical protein
VRATLVVDEWSEAGELDQPAAAPEQPAKEVRP